MQTRHQNRKQYFEEQAFTTKKYVIPYIENGDFKINKNTSILEIGCAEGGNMKPFLDLECKVTGIDLNENSLKKAENFFLDHPQKNNLRLILKDIYKADQNTFGQFDVIILRDVIEHIPNQEKFMEHVKIFMHNKTRLFIGFPPWQMPFGGHQQACRNKIVSKLPYIHLFPKFIYGWILKLFGESQATINSRFEIKDTGITIDRLDKIVNNLNFKILNKTPYLINPNYEIKFKMAPKKQFSLINKIPYFKNYVTTCCYFLLSKS